MVNIVFPFKKYFSLNANFFLGVFTVTKSDNDSQSKDPNTVDHLWLVVKSMKTENGRKGYMLKQNDIIKLGRFKFRVKELQSMSIIDDKEVTTSELPHFEMNNEDEGLEKIDFINKYKVQQIEEITEITCRICLHGENTPENPLISPCACSGSVKHIHLNCLKYWIKSKAITKTYGICISYIWKTLECELCHKTLPDIIIHDSQIIDLIDIPKPESSYIILETLGKEKQPHKVFYVVLATNNGVIKLGRGHDCDVRISDISVSRFHAYIQYINGKFYLNDNESKFGTLVLVKNYFTLDPDFDPAIQVGRTVLSFSLNNKNSSSPHRLPATIKPKEPSNYDGLNNQLHLLLPKRDHEFVPHLNFFEQQKIIDPTPNTKSNSPRPITHEIEDDYDIINKKMFSLTLNKDKNDYSHLQELLEKQSKIAYNRVKGQDDKAREKKNILNEMQNLSINDDDESESDMRHKDQILKNIADEEDL